MESLRPDLNLLFKEKMKPFRLLFVFLCSFHRLWKFKKKGQICAYRWVNITFSNFNSNIILNGNCVYYGFIFSTAGRRAALILPNSGIFSTFNQPWGLGGVGGRGVGDDEAWLEEVRWGGHKTNFNIIYRTPVRVIIATDKSINETKYESYTKYHMVC